MLYPLLVAAALPSCSSTSTGAPPTTSEGPGAGTSATASANAVAAVPTTVSVGQQTCATVMRPTTGEMAVPDASGGDRLAGRITWSNSVTLDPPPPDVNPIFTKRSIHLDESTPPPVIKLAVYHDPSHRTRTGDGRLVWAVFYPQVPFAGEGGPFDPGGRETTTTGDPLPCAMNLATFDAATGAPYLYMSIGCPRPSHAGRLPPKCR